MLRSCYDVDMVFWPGGPPIRVRYFFTAKGAKIIDGPNLFNSRNWEDDKTQVFDLGEQPGPRTYYRGQRPFCAFGKVNCGFGKKFADGQEGPFNPPLAVTFQGVPKCCCGCPCAVINPPSAPSTVFVQGCGGVAAGGRSATCGDGMYCSDGGVSLGGSAAGNPVPPHWDCAEPFIVMSCVGFAADIFMSFQTLCRWTGGQSTPVVITAVLDDGGPGGLPRLFIGGDSIHPAVHEQPLLFWDGAAGLAVFEWIETYGPVVGSQVFASVP